MNTISVGEGFTLAISVGEGFTLAAAWMMY